MMQSRNRDFFAGGLMMPTGLGASLRAVLAARGRSNWVKISSASCSPSRVPSEHPALARAAQDFEAVGREQSSQPARFGAGLVIVIDRHVADYARNARPRYGRRQFDQLAIN
jgi:hypothetical protein